MVISDRYRYLFVEFPNSASTAIAGELVENYSGKTILYKHALYSEFLKFASQEQKGYFVFSSIRNPLDAMVSRFVRYKHNHQGLFTDPSRQNSNRADGLGYGKAVMTRFAFANQEQVTYADYLRRFYKIPYSSWANLHHKSFDYIIRFETLQEDFSTALQMLNITQVRELLRLNQTEEKKASYLTYYTKDIQYQAVQVFGPYMLEWGYQIPPEWGIKVHPLMKLVYQVLKPVKNFRFHLQSMNKMRAFDPGLKF